MACCVFLLSDNMAGIVSRLGNTAYFEVQDTMLGLECVQ